MVQDALNNVRRNPKPRHASRNRTANIMNAPTGNIVQAVDFALPLTEARHWAFAASRWKYIPAADARQCSYGFKDATLGHLSPGDFEERLRLV